MGGGFHVQNAMSHELAWKFGESCHTKSKHQGRKLSILITGHVIDTTLVIPESELVHPGQICALVSCGWRISWWSQDRDPCKSIPQWQFISHCMKKNHSMLPCDQHCSVVQGITDHAYVLRTHSLLLIQKENVDSQSQALCFNNYYSAFTENITACCKMEIV